MSKLTNVLVLVKWGAGQRGDTEAYFSFTFVSSRCALLTVLTCLLCSPSLVFPLGFSGVMHGIVIVVSVEVGRVVGKREVRALSMVSTGGFNGSGLGEHVFFPSSFLSSQVMKGSAQASEHPQMLWSLQVDIE